MTAEAALVLPVLAALTLALVWMLSLAVAQMRVTDAAREAARSVARGDPVAEAERLAMIAAPGATVRVESSGGKARVEVALDVRAPGELLGHLGRARLDAIAETRVEGERGDP